MGDEVDLQKNVYLPVKKFNVVHAKIPASIQPK